MKKTSIVLSTVLGAVAGAAATGKVLGKSISRREEQGNKMGMYYTVFNQWLMLKQEGKSLVSYFQENHYKTVAIYGMKELGERLFDELAESDIEVKYIIDKNAESVYAEVDVLKPEDELPQVDVIVVTAAYYFYDIEEELSNMVDYPVVSIEDIIYEL